MANRTIFDFWPNMSSKDLADLLLNTPRHIGIDWGKTIGVSAASFSIPPFAATSSRQVHTPRGLGVTLKDFAVNFNPRTPNAGKVMEWLITIVAPNGCPSCKNDPKGAWTATADALTDTYVLHCDVCGWSQKATSELIADFVMGRQEDPRDFDACTCGRRKRKISKLCTECVEVNKWDLCACGVKKLKAYHVCSDCILAEDKFGKLVAIEHGGLIECR